MAEKIRDMSDIKIGLDVQDTKQIRDCIELQLTEIDMLQSMFPDNSEFQIEENDLQQMRSYVEGSNALLPSLEYCIHLTSEEGKVSLHVAIPTCYPHELPDIYVRSNDLSRPTQLDLNLELNLFLESLEKGDLVIGSIIAWLQEHITQYLLKDSNTAEASDNKIPSTFNEETFCRMWIYSHHIYSKASEEKRFKGIV